MMTYKSDGHAVPYGLFIEHPSTRKRISLEWIEGATVHHMVKAVGLGFASYFYPEVELLAEPDWFGTDQLLE